LKCTFTTELVIELGIIFATKVIKKAVYYFTSYTILFKKTTWVLDRVPYQVLYSAQVLNSSTCSISTHHRLHRTILHLVAVFLISKSLVKLKL